MTSPKTVTPLGGTPARGVIVGPAFAGNRWSLFNFSGASAPFLLILQDLRRRFGGFGESLRRDLTSRGKM